MIEQIKVAKIVLVKVPYNTYKAYEARGEKIPYIAYGINMNLNNLSARFRKNPLNPTSYYNARLINIQGTRLYLTSPEGVYSIGFTTNNESTECVKMFVDPMDMMHLDVLEGTDTFGVLPWANTYSLYKLLDNKNNIIGYIYIKGSCILSEQDITKMYRPDTINNIYYSACIAGLIDVKNMLGYRKELLRERTLPYAKGHTIDAHYESQNKQKGKKNNEY